MQDFKTYHNHHVHLHADCIPVWGVQRSAIYDLTRSDIILFPSEYFELLKVLKVKKLGTVLSETVDKEQQEHVIAFVNFLLDNELAMFLENPTMFPEIPEAWDTPCIIQNAIIDVDKKLHNFEKIFNELNTLGCHHLQVRSFSNLLSIEDLNNMLSKAHHSSLQGIELLLKYNKNIPDIDYIQLVEEQPIIANLTVHSAPAEKDLTTTHGYHGALKQQLEKEVNFITEQITSQYHCGIINMKNLSVPSVNSFFENKLFNGCLNRKVSVDINGEIKNCPSMPESFGNIKDTPITAVVSKEKFQEKWHIVKDQIETCKNCEFRYACTDCRAYVEKPEDQFSKPLKCGYDPNTGQWEAWSTNPLKQRAILHYESENNVAFTNTGKASKKVNVA